MTEKNGFSSIENYMFEDHDMIKRAATECMCNLASNKLVSAFGSLCFFLSHSLLFIFKFIFEGKVFSPWSDILYVFPIKRPIFTNVKKRKQ